MEGCSKPDRMSDVLGFAKLPGQNDASSLVLLEGLRFASIMEALMLDGFMHS